MKTNANNLQVLYEDNHLITINKRPGDLSQGDKTGDLTLSDFIKEFIRKRDSKPGNVFCGTIHRIDRPTSGILIYAKTSKGLERMNKLFREKGVQKIYWAIVEGRLNSKEGEINNFLLKNPKQNKSYVVNKQNKEGKHAISFYRVLAENKNHTLLEVSIETGRHHQIRTHLSSIGHPIKGDLKYGAKTNNKDLSIDLLAREINFIHPIKKEAIHIVAPIPSDQLWRELTNLL